MNKHIKIFFGAMLACSPCVMAHAQAENDSVESEKVPVAFKNIDKEDLLGGVSVLDYEELTKKNFNTYSLDNMQAYINGFNGNSPWASGSYLVLVDGVPREATTVLPTDIDKITFLKSGAAVALYGSTAAKGAILITTKKGKEGPLRINGRVNYGVNTAKRYPKYLGSAEYMTLYNEARVNDGLDPLYSAQDIYNYGSGLNPYRYPNVDFYSSDYIKKAYSGVNANVDITGGGKNARFYANINYYRNSDVFKFGEGKKNYTDQLSFRGNVDLDINDWISAYVHSQVTFYSGKGTMGADYWGTAATLRPNRVAPLIPISYVAQNATGAQALLAASANIIDGKYFLAGTQLDQTNAFADFYAAGKNTYTARQFQFDVGLNMNLDRFVKGLSFQAQFAVDYATSYNTNYSNTYATFEPTWANYNGQDVITGLKQYNNDKHSGVQNVANSASKQTILFNAQFNYQTKLADLHNISAMVIANGYQVTTAGTYHKTSNVNLGIEAAYNYAHRYYAQFDGAVVHSAKLAPGHRTAFSPSLTLGWKMKQEPWLRDVDAIDELTISASVSELNTDVDITDYYMYSPSYTASGQWWGWADGISVQATESLRGGNTDLTFVKRKEVSASVHASFFDHLLEVDASYWYNIMDGGIIEPKTVYPNYLSYKVEGWIQSSFIPYINYNKDRRTGFDLGLKVNKTFGEVDLSLGANMTYYTTKATRRDEKNADAYQNLTGKPLDGLWGLITDGFYKDDADIESSPTPQYGEVKPGDLKYVDQNNDGVIDIKDEVYLGKGGWYGSPYTLGINFTAKWKGFTFFALATGGFGAKAFKNSSYYWVSGDGKYSEIVRGRWTKETADTATYPRLTTQSGNHNFRNSDFWLYSTDRFDLAKIQITYDLPSSLFKNTIVRGLQVYVSGNSLLTFSGERELMEMNIGSAPQYRNFNLGVYVNL